MFKCLIKCNKLTLCDSGSKYNITFNVTGNNMNTFLNENWKDILAELQTNFESALAAAFSGVAQQFFSRVPYNQVFVE